MNSNVSKILTEVHKVIIGKDEVLEKILMTLLSRGHVLLDDVPGTGKTTAALAFHRALGLRYGRIQFTPDVLPSDIVGFSLYRKETGDFVYQPGAVMTNLLLADEINRTPPKTQSALLGAMQEQEITAAGTTRKLEQPFFVLATQNPIEQEGTYPLPEAQLDRFMFSLILDYPTLEEEIAIVESTTGQKTEKLNRIVTGEEILKFQSAIRLMPVSKHITEYAVKLVARTRPGRSGAHPLAEQYLNWGAGPRASQFLISGAKTHAALQGKYAPDIEDVKYVAEAILRHRIFKNYKAEAEHIRVEDLIREFIK